ncbi:MAG TPA: hypothetical protein VF406_12715 [Thermodesulfobacteriota bacterium]
MRPLAVWLLGGLAFVVVAGAPRDAAATFPVLLSARSLSPGATEGFLAGGYGNTAPDYWTALAGARHGLLRRIEVGARAGAAWVEAPDDTDLAPVVGADVKVEVLRESIDIPIDLAIDASWTVARPGGDTWSDLAFTALFGKRVRIEWLDDLIGPDRLATVVGAQLVFLGGTARPGREDSAAYGLVGLEIALPAGLAVLPEAKVGTDAVFGLSLRYQF